MAMTRKQTSRRAWRRNKAYMAGKPLPFLPTSRGHKLRRKSPAEVKQDRKNADILLWRRNQRIVAEIKAKTPCVDCGESDPRCLDFDHRERETKVKTISYMVKMRYAEKRLLAEIAKCDMRCANCHRKRSHDGKHHLRLES